MSSRKKYLSTLQSKKKYKQTRIGNKAARVLVARTNDSSMDRMDISYATKELCRSFQNPTPDAVDCLKRLGRYLIGKKRLV